MKLPDFLNKLFPACPLSDRNTLVALLEPGWEQSVQTFSSDWPVLRPDYVTEQLSWCQFRDEVVEPLNQAQSIIRKDLSLALLGWHCHRLLFDSPEYTRIREWVALTPELDRIEWGLGSTFFLWIALETVTRLRTLNDQRGIPENITRATLGDFLNMELRYAAVNPGRVGLSPKWSMNWLRTMASGNLHRIGRLSYILRNFRGEVESFRNQDTGEILALSLPDLSCTEEGYLAMADESVSWVTSRKTKGSILTGHPVHPSGKILPTPVDLDLRQWQQILDKESFVMEIHIPRNGALNHQTTLQSFLDAKTFFQRHYPESSPHAYACYSWMLNPQLREFLGSQSNLVAWQEEFYLLPFTSTGKDGLYFVFGEEDLDENAPRDTRLRRAMLDHLQAGKKLRNGGMFFLIEDLTKHGRQPYQNPPEIIR